MPQNRKDSPGPLITPARLRELYGLLVRTQAAEKDVAQLFAGRHWPASCKPWLRHPAIVAGCFAQLQAGDVIAPVRLEFAANLASGTALAGCVSSLAIRATAKRPRGLRAPSTLEGLSQVCGAAQVLQATAPQSVVVAVANEPDLAGDEAVVLLRRIAALTLPVVLITLSARLPEPGESQNDRGIQQMSVAGDDVVACYRVSYESLLRARTGIGPTWIRVWAGSDIAGRGATASTLRTMKHFLQTRNLYDPTQAARESAAWSSDWKLAIKAAKRGKSDGAGLPIRALDLLP
jgi:TPP-dependent pyruvate/acetoin dehydrogenase alpha subunit